MNRSSLIIELVGVAGSGKTTLSQTLSGRSKSIMAKNPPFVRKASDSFFFFRHCFLIVPTLLRIYKNKNNDKFLTRREIAWMAILNGWHHILQRERANDGKVIILDQGPVYIMAQLQMFNSESLRSVGIRKWWNGVYRKWATTLDIVVYLDTSDTKLLERIRSRAKWHLVKEKTEAEIFDFLEHYRVAYKEVLGKLIANHTGLRVLRFDTAQESLDKVVKKLLTEISLKDDESKNMYYKSSAAID